MIEVKNLIFSEIDGFSNGIDLTVKNGEVYFLLCKNEKYLFTLFEFLRGFKALEPNIIFADSLDISCLKQIPISWINRVEDIKDFDSEPTLLDTINFMSNNNKTMKKKILELLLTFNLFENNLKTKVKYTPAETFQAVYLAISLAADYQNIVIYDFIRGAGKEFEIQFNKLIKEKLEEGKAILYLTTDLFYAVQVADRVSFIKNGYLMPENPILYEDLKEMDMVKLYNQYFR